MPAIGEKLRKTVARRYGVESCDGHRLATRRGHLEERSTGIGSEQDGSVTIPGASPSGAGVGDHLRRATHDVDAFQFAIREQSYRRAVGRPEWIRRSVRSRQWMCGERIQWPNPELRFVFIRCREHQPPAIRRNGKGKRIAS